MLLIFRTCQDSVASIEEDDHVGTLRVAISSMLHPGRYCYSKTPIATFIDSLHLAKEKQLDKHLDKSDKNQTQSDNLLSVG